MVKVTLSNGKILWFPETMSDDEIRKRVAEEEQPKTDLLQAAKHGWWQGLSEGPSLLGGAVGLVEDIIPGKQEGIERFEQKAKGWAEDIRRKGGEEQPDTFAEKVVSGLSAAPGSLLTMAPFMAAGAAAIPAEGIGAAMAAGALGMGAYSAVRSGGEGLPTSLGEGLRGAAEGAAFGGIGGLAGRYGGKEAAAIMRQVRRAAGPDEAEALLKAAAKAAESKSLQRRLIHAVGGGGVVAASGLSRGENLEDALASGAAMGLLGLKSGAYRPKDVIGGERLIKVEREAEKMAEELRKKREEEGVVEPPVEAATDTIIPPLEAKNSVGTPPSSGLVVAAIGRDGKLYYGKPGEIHTHLSIDNPEAVPWKAVGFSGPDGVFLDRKQALEVAGPIKSSTPGELGAMDYREQAAPVETKQGTLLGFEQYKPRKITPDLMRQFPADEELSGFPKRATPTERQELLSEMYARHPKDTFLGVRRSMENVEERAKSAEVNPYTGAIEVPEGHGDVKIYIANQIAKETEAQLKDLTLRQKQAEKAGDVSAVESIGEQMRDIELRQATSLAVLRDKPSEASSMMRLSTLSDETRAVRKAKQWVKNNKELRDRFIKTWRMSQGNPEILDKLYDAIKDPTLFGSLYEIWINGLLSGIPTESVNATSNYVKQQLAALEHRVMVGVDVLRSRGGAKERELYLSDLYGAKLGGELGSKIGKEAFRIAWKEDPAGQKESFLKNSESPIDQRMGNIPGKWGYWGRWPSRLLSGVDMWFKAKAGVKAGYVEAMRIAREKMPTDKGGNLETWAKMAQEMMQNVDVKTREGKRILKAQSRAAEEETFTTPPEQGSLPWWLMKGRKLAVNVPLVGEIRPLAIVLPFVNVPWNIIRESVKRSPLGALEWNTFRKASIEARDALGAAEKRHAQFMKDEARRNAKSPGREKDPEVQKLVQQKENSLYAAQRAAAEASMAYTKSTAQMIVGNTVFLSVLGLAKMGAVTGGGPSDPNEKRNLLDTGWKPYAFKIGDQYISLARIEPLGTVLGMAADAVEASEEDFNTPEFYGKMWAAIKDNLANKTFLYGLENISKAWADPERFGPAYAKQMMGTMMPMSSFIGRTQQALDPITRQTDLGQSVHGVPEPLAARIPGLSQELPQRSTVLGEPAERWSYGPGVDAKGILGKAARAVSTSVSPIVWDKEKEARVQKEFHKLRHESGMPPSMPAKKKSLILDGPGGERIKLTDEEYKVYDKYHQMAAVALDRMISSPGWDNIPDAYKAAQIKKVYGQYRSMANQVINLMIRRRVALGRK